MMTRTHNYSHWLLDMAEFMRVTLTLLCKPITRLKTRLMATVHVKTESLPIKQYPCT